MKTVTAFIKKEPILIAAALLAAASMVLVPPTVQYVHYIDYAVIGVLFCLMLVVAGFRELGVLDFLSAALIHNTKSVKALRILLINGVFFSSMFFTNDVALIAFVPLTAGIFRIYGREGLISTVVLETIAANVGSMLTPVGNPQNLYLFSFYHLGLSRFLLIVLPTVAVGYVLLMGILLVSKNSQVEVRATRRVSFGQRKSLFFCVAGSFILCVLAVLRAVDYRICVPAVLLCLLLADRKLYKKADYGLLLTFVAFFIFAGNIEQLPAVKDALAGLLAGRAFPVSLLGSQVVSNVPAAMMAARFTDDTRGVLLGVNIGGLGTPVASLASLIAFRLYAKSENAAPRRYWGVFTVYNVIFLAVLAGAAVLLG